VIGRPRSVRKIERTESADSVDTARGVDVFRAKAKLGVSDCVFRSKSDRDSDLIRTAIRFNPDTVPIDFGQCSGSYPDSFRARRNGVRNGSEACPE
jgi:hypothetical protein